MTDYKTKLLQLFLTFEKENVELAYSIADGAFPEFYTFLVDRYQDIIHAYRINNTFSHKKIIVSLLDKLEDENSYVLYEAEEVVFSNSISDFTFLTEINIYGDIKGDIPQQLTKLHQLRKISYASESLKNISPDLYTLSNIEELRFDHVNSFSTGISSLHKLSSLDIHLSKKGEIPSEIFTLRQLEFLYLEGNSQPIDITGISSLRHLIRLMLKNFSMTEIPKEIVGIDRLIQLNLENNHIKTIPPDIVRLWRLDSLILRNNQIEDIPPCIGDLRDGISLFFENNKIKTLPVNLNQIPIERLNVSNNQINLQLIDKTFWSNQIQFLELGMNHISALPQEIGEMKYLTALDIKNNLLEEFPVELVNIPHLESLNIIGNPISKLPDDICKMEKLEYLNVSEQVINNSSQKVQAFLEDIFVSHEDRESFDLISMPLLKYFHQNSSSS